MSDSDSAPITPDPPVTPAPRAAAPRLRDLLRLFVWLGCSSFGGPAVHIALMEDAVVRQRGWLPRDRFLRLLGITNLLPGPNSAEMAMQIGQAHAGPLGLILSGVAFILPAALISTALAWAYARVGVTPPVVGMLYGLKPVIVAVVGHALWRLARTGLRTPALLAVGVLALAANAIHLHELIVLLGAGLVHLLLQRPGTGRAARGAAASGGGGGGGAGAGAGAHALATSATTWAVGATTAATTATTAAAIAPPALSTMFLVFLKIGSVLFGSGYVLLIFLRADIVQRYHWLTESQLLDAIAIGQVVPGPVTTTVTFIGYLLAGPWGALVSTVAVFLPAFCLVGLSSRFVPLVERSPALQALLDGVVAGSLALIAIVTIELGQAALIDLPTCLIAALTLIALARFGANPAWCVAGAALAGLFVHLVLS